MAGVTEQYDQGRGEGVWGNVAGGWGWVLGSRTFSVPSLAAYVESVTY